jgi:hypothetical protein
MAGALYVNSTGLRLSGAALTPSSGVITPAAGALAKTLPSDVLALISIQGLKSALASTLNQPALLLGLPSAERSQLKAMQRNLTDNLAGEADLVLFKPGGKLSLSSSQLNLPLALLWQVRNTATAQRDLANAARRFKINNELTSHSAADGTQFQAASQGYGYAVRRGWAIVSPAVAQTIHVLSTSPQRPLSDLLSYRAAMRSGTLATSLWYVNATTLRQTLEQAFLPTIGNSTASEYREYVQPVLAPIHTLSGSAGTTAHRTVAVSNVVIQIGK